MSLRAAPVLALASLSLFGCASTSFTPPTSELVYFQDVSIPEGVYARTELHNNPQPLNEDWVRHSELWRRFGRSISLFYGEYTFDYNVVVFVNEVGLAYDVQIRSANSEFGLPELAAALKQLKCEPGLRNGLPVKYYVEFPVSLSLDRSVHYELDVPEPE
ncbi:MAG: hypothetical protein E1N59_1685 [Puniceicoccaceae bacterium 5H]|nr:MAG: hypothetical protein E1N59_1685 [Puniceicoccaceae bacterium 5H]